MRLDPIVIVPYDPAWATSFDVQRDRVQGALGDLLTGRSSTSGAPRCRGCAAKPIVDMVAVVENIDDAQPAIARLESVAWVHTPEPTDALDRSLSFCTPSIAHRTHHLHVVEDASDGWRGWLAFRDHLRAHPDVAMEYSVLKADLATRHGANPNERDAYRGGKADFIVSVTKRARKG